ncbi:hypothetical protein R3P38DRAFT_3377665 [Favolaschia claudopus]|uniref:Uncharacterized protein n=1 Tax=Favolaschia claudopus TaxID=2862362 RepID=A0AAV9ZBF7_9AGAR
MIGILLDFIFSPAVRVWNLRILLLGVAYQLYDDTFRITDQGVVNASSVFPGIPLLCLLLVHHLAGVIPWTLSLGLALVDLVLVVFEFVAETILTYRHLSGMLHNNTLTELVAELSMSGTIALACRQLIPVQLALTIMFRIATFPRLKAGFGRRQSMFLKGCASTNPPYTPWRILIGRSIARPLVRGEARLIIWFRGILIAAIAVAVPLLGVYFIVVVPAESQVYTKLIQSRQQGPQGKANITMSLSSAPDWLASSAETVPRVPTVFGTITRFARQNGTGTQQSVCSQGSGEADNLTVMPMTFNCEAAGIVNQECSHANSIGSFPWNEVINIVISLQVPEDSAIRVTFGAETLGTLLFPRAQLVGEFSWSRRDQITSLGIRSAVSTIFSAQISSLQTVFSNSSKGDLATLTLYQTSPDALRLHQDTVDVTFLTGMSTFGGFWTFLNGVFALFFGAHVLYFMFGRKPLSALGILHIFQRGALVRRWYDDFPAIQTEGGLPGSQSAGIVAFIRERLVDLEEDPRLVENEKLDEKGKGGEREGERDFEAQIPEAEETQKVSSVDERMGTRPRSTAGKRGYILDEISPLAGSRTTRNSIDSFE